MAIIPGGLVAQLPREDGELPLRIAAEYLAAGALSGLPGLQNRVATRESLVWEDVSDPGIKRGVDVYRVTPGWANHLSAALVGISGDEVYLLGGFGNPDLVSFVNNWLVWNADSLSVEGLPLTIARIADPNGGIDVVPVTEGGPEAADRLPSQLNDTVFTVGEAWTVVRLSVVSRSEGFVTEHQVITYTFVFDQGLRLLAWNYRVIE